MKIWLIRRTDTNQYMTLGRHWGSKTARTFSRLSDLSFHLNYHTTYDSPPGFYFNVPTDQVVIVEYDLDALTKREIPLPQLNCKSHNQVFLEE